MDRDQALKELTLMHRIESLLDDIVATVRDGDSVDTSIRAQGIIDEIKEAGHVRPEPSEDRVEAVRRILQKYKAFVLNYDHGTSPRCNQDDAAEEILKLCQPDQILSLLEPVELEALENEEDGEMDEFYKIYDRSLAYKAVSQATIQKNQAKGQLFRLKEG